MTKIIRAKSDNYFYLTESVERAISDIVSWEFYENYSKPLSVDEIVKGNNPRDVLAGKIAKYKKQIIE